jgi:hypothetical protein
MHQIFLEENEKFDNLYVIHIIKVVESGGWDKWDSFCLRKDDKLIQILVGELEKKIPFGLPSCGWEGVIEMIPKEEGCRDVY